MKSIGTTVFLSCFGERMLGVDFKWQKADERSRLPDNKRKQKHLQTSDLVTLDAETYHCQSDIQSD